MAIKKLLQSLFVILLLTTIARAGEIRLGVFNVDASPPIGSPLAYDPCVEVTTPLSCRGIVLHADGEPIVIAVVDWLGVANGAHRSLRLQIAEAVETSVDRVAVHSIHQHDAPRCDFSAAALLEQFDGGHAHYDVPWIQRVFANVARGAAQASKAAIPVTHLKVSQAKVERVASNRRLLDESGKVFATRYTACRDPKLRAYPAGTIDPWLRAITFYSGQKPVAVMSYYATHPQSYYRTGRANPDFPGYARNQREEETGVPHIHFNGAGGNIGAGKWNDGSPENRAVLASRVADAMKQAFESGDRQPIDSSSFEWDSRSVQLPLGEHLEEAKLSATLSDETKTSKEKLTAAKHLAWLRRHQSGETIDIQCLSINDARILHMPGELFVEYQLTAASIRSDLFVAMAAYGEYGPGYIGTEVAYAQGGYEVSAGASRVGKGSEAVLNQAMRELLKAPENK